VGAVLGAVRDVPFCGGGGDEVVDVEAEFGGEEEEEREWGFVDGGKALLCG
jgi:hypothetical protein